MPLLAWTPQLNSICSLKSSNLEVLRRSGPLPSFTNVPSSAFQEASLLRLRGTQPVRSLPLNNVTGCPHLGEVFRLSSGARTPFHCQTAPAGSVTVPTSS